jgi:hypothetical protein
MPNKILTPEQKTKKAAYLKAWKLKNAEHIKQYNDAYHAANPDYEKERCKKWKRKNREKVSEYNRKWNKENRERRNELNKQWQQSNPEYRDNKFAYNLMYNYNITVDDYNRMLANQDGHCAACPATERTVGRVRRLCVDHARSCCPRTKSCGKCVRGLLCNPCNRALGLLMDNEETLSQLIAYLKRTRWINALGQVRPNPETVRE